MKEKEIEMLNAKINELTAENSKLKSASAKAKEIDELTAKLKIELITEKIKVATSKDFQLLKVSCGTQ